METFVTVIHVFLCIFMIGVVLLQSGKSDMGSAFGGGGSQAVLTAASGTTLLGKITAGVAMAFMCTSMTLAWFSSSAAHTESVIQGDILDELDADVAPVLPDAPAVQAEDEVAPAVAPASDEAAPVPAEDAAPAPEDDGSNP